MFTFQSSKKTASCRRQSHRVGVSCASSVPPPLGPTLSSPAETTSHNIRVLSTQQHTMLLNSLFYVSISTTVYFIPIWVPIYTHSYTGNASLLQLLQVSQDYAIWTCTVRKWHLFSANIYPQEYREYLITILTQSGNCTKLFYNWEGKTRIPLGWESCIILGKRARSWTHLHRRHQGHLGTTHEAHTDHDTKCFHSCKSRYRSAWTLGDYFKGENIWFQ